MLWGAFCAGAQSLPFLSPIFGDHMVLQRGKPNSLWGWSQPGDKVRVEIADASAAATAGSDGKWQVRIDPPAVGGPYTLARCASTFCTPWAG
jgi:sialate O-acetylesterase